MSGILKPNQAEVRTELTANMLPEEKQPAKGLTF